MREKLNNFRASYKEFKARLIKKLERPVAVCKLIFGYGIMLTLFAGGSLAAAFAVKGDIKCFVDAVHTLPSC